MERHKRGIMLDDGNENAILERKYSHNFLSKVIVRIDFATPITLTTGLRKKVNSKVKEDFPIYAEEAQVQLMAEFTVQKDKSLEQTARQSTPSKAWTWKNPNTDRRLWLSETELWVEHKKYESYDLLSKQFSTILKLVLMTERDLRSKRLGLRYIDTIDLDEDNPTDWEGYFHPSLLTGFTIADDPTKIARAFNLLETVYDDMQIRFQYGMMNPDYPQVMCRKQFILDHDAYTTELLDKSQIFDVLDNLRKKAKICFEKVITDKLRAKMGQL